VSGKYDLPAGNSNFGGTPVPAGYIVRVTSWAVVVTFTTCTKFRFYPNVNGALTVLKEVVGPTSTVVYQFGDELLLKEGDYIGVRLYGMTVNDDIEMYAVGYEMRIA